MQSFHARQLLIISSTFTLAACQDASTAPRAPIGKNAVSAVVRGCFGGQPERQALSKLPVHSGAFGFELPTVIVTAQFPSGPLPWGIMQQMQFPLGYGADQAPCLGAAGETYSVDTLTVAPLEPEPVPDGVDPGWWYSLSPREQRALIAKAQLLMQLYPDRYKYIGAAINQVFRDKMLKAKVESRLRANDFGLVEDEGALLAGGIYGCMLYQNFVRDPEWILSNDETREFVISLVTAFAESEYATSPLRALRFGRNGAIGAALAQASANFGDCGWQIFNSVPSGRINISDPYGAAGGFPRPGGGTPPWQAPPDGPPPEWHDY
jgi:hypothetical protein